MDNIGDLAYILVFIVWFLYRIFVKTGKKTSPSSPPFDPSTDGGESTATAPPRGKTREATPPPMTFEEMLRELTGAPQPAVEEEPEDYYESDDSYEEEDESSFEVLEPMEDSPTPPKFESTGKFKEFELRPKRTSKAAKAAIKMFKSPQGAKQAFIMKEIFDRKY